MNRMKRSAFPRHLRHLFVQDRSRWDGDLVAEGLKFLDRSAAGDELTEYHVEAGIAALHTGAGSAEKTRWSDIVALYDTLMKIRPSPVVALNRAIALAEHLGPERGLEAIGAPQPLEFAGQESRVAGPRNNRSRFTA